MFWVVTRNLHQRIFRKVLTIRKRWSNDEFFYDSETDIKLPTSFLQIFLNILEYIWWSLHSSILFISMSKRWRKVIFVVKLSHRTTTQIKTQKFSKFREHQQKTFVTLNKRVVILGESVKNENSWRKSFFSKC